MMADMISAKEPVALATCLLMLSASVAASSLLLVCDRRQNPRTEDVFDRSRECLDAHNVVRRHHQVEDMEVDKRLASYAKLIATRLYYNPSSSLASKPYGINVHFGPRVNNSDCTRIVEIWYNQVEKYDFKQPSFQEEAKFFTQLVWQETTKLGCASSLDTFNPTPGNRSTLGYFTVCIYSPKGNIEGKFAENVLPRID